MVGSRRLVALLLALAALALTAPVTAPTTAAAQTPRRCNGLAVLCDRSVGEVVFPTAHNAMSSPADHFRGPNQGRPISWQLDHGIRGFQVDAYLGVPVGTRVYTSFTGPLTAAQRDLAPNLLAVGEQLHRRLGAPAPGAATGVYLCHTFCELGFVKLADELAVVRRFLDTHPDEVLQVVIEDHVPAARLRAELDAAGLGSELASYVKGEPLPTLGQMLDAGHHLLVSLEHGDGGPQLPRAFDGLVEETPFHFTRATQLRGRPSCRDHRGTTGSPVFQLNHWVTPPMERHAVAANRLLTSRTATCEQMRNRVPTLVAVDFADRSDVVAVAERINAARH